MSSSVTGSSAGGSSTGGSVMVVSATGSSAGGSATGSSAGGSATGSSAGGSAGLNVSVGSNGAKEPLPPPPPPGKGLSERISIRNIYWISRNWFFCKWFILLGSSTGSPISSWNLSNYNLVLGLYHKSYILVLLHIL